MTEYITKKKGMKEGEVGGGMGCDVESEASTVPGVWKGGWRWGVLEVGGGLGADLPGHLYPWSQTAALYPVGRGQAHLKHTGHINALP